jgi:hypothetical protein
VIDLDLIRAGAPIATTVPAPPMCTRQFLPLHSANAEVAAARFRSFWLEPAARPHHDCVGHPAHLACVSSRR